MAKPFLILQRLLVQGNQRTVYSNSISIPHQVIITSYIDDELQGSQYCVGPSYEKPPFTLDLKGEWGKPGQEQSVPEVANEKEAKDERELDFSPEEESPDDDEIGPEEEEDRDWDWDEQSVGEGGSDENEEEVGKDEGED